MKSPKRPLCLGSVLLLMIFCLGCASIALQVSSPLFPKFSESIFEECDSQLAKTAMPAQLKLLEGLLKSDPENKALLTTLAMGFSGFTLLYVEDDDPDRASNLYLRARDYGMKALGPKGPNLKNLKNLSLKEIKTQDLQALFWTTVAWNAWINLNLDKPAAIAQLGAAQACLKKVLELDPEYFHGLPYILMGISLSARSPMFGGDVAEAKVFFEKALDLRERKFLLAQYYYARYYAVRVQNKKLFFELLDEIGQGKTAPLKDVCLINTMAKEKAAHLKEMSEDFFF
ncbi:MAG: hypothetical protein JRG79_01425 [Deltaproteobacteria bacterium]|nr:hypothetical protein [Deltaproteobacteria bacterium]